MRKIVALILFSATSSIPKAVVHEATTYTIHHTINGHDFIAQRDCVNGKLHEEWRIDGQMVDFDFYVSKLTAAEAEERRSELAIERAGARKEAEHVAALKTKTAQKIARIAVQSIESEIKHIRDCDLEPYLQFSPTTIPSRSEYTRLIYQLIPDVQTQIERGESDYNALIMLADELERQAKHLHDLIQESIQHLVDHCSDTKTLRKLLEYLD